MIDILITIMLINQLPLNARLVVTNQDNSGLWLDYKFQQPEDQVKFCLPLNRDTEHLYYNTRLIIDANVLTEPRAWVISKINRNNIKGVSIFTCAQDLFNQHTDVAFYDDDGNVKYWVADWKSSAVNPDEAVVDNTALFASITSKITYSGTSSQIKVGGSKTFTLTFYDDDIPVEHDCGEWSFIMNGVDITDKLTLSYPAANKVKVRVPSDDSLIGKILSITNTYDDIVSSIDVEVIAL